MPPVLPEPEGESGTEYVQKLRKVAAEYKKQLQTSNQCDEIAIILDDIQDYLDKELPPQFVALLEVLRKLKKTIQSKSFSVAGYRSLTKEITEQRRALDEWCNLHPDPEEEDEKAARKKRSATSQRKVIAPKASDEASSSEEDDEGDSVEGSSSEDDPDFIPRPQKWKHMVVQRDPTMPRNDDEEEEEEEEEEKVNEVATLSTSNAGREEEPEEVEEEEEAEKTGAKEEENEPEEAPSSSPLSSNGNGNTLKRKHTPPLTQPDPPKRRIPNNSHMSRPTMVPELLSTE